MSLYGFPPRAIGRLRKLNSIAKCTDWNPSIALTESLCDVLAYWELKLQHG